jgi:DNA-binding FadR family transcriptional regulator
LPPTGDGQRVGPAERNAALLPLLLPNSGGTVSTRIQVALERAIALGLFPDGRLPAERLLAANLDVSRTALRSALELVRHSGYADRSLVGRHGGVPTSRVPHLTPDEVAATADRALAEVGELFRVRRFLEPALARAAAADGSPERLQRLVRGHGRLTGASTVAAHEDIGGELHYELATVAGTDEIIGCAIRARADLLRWRDRLPMEDPVEHSIIEHGAIIDAIGAAEPDRAATAMTTHLARAEDRYRRFLQHHRARPGIGPVG